MISELLEKVGKHKNDGLPFVIYRKPKRTKVHAVFQKDAKLNHLTDFNETGFVFAPFDSQTPSILLKPDEQLEIAYEPIAAKPWVFSSQTEIDNTQKEGHVKLVQKGLGVMKRTGLRKVVLSRRFAIACEKSPADLFQSLLETYTNAFCYWWHHPKVGTWLGATPEILWKSENKQFKTMSLAGTRIFVENQEPQWGHKELIEQEMVTDFIKKALNEKVIGLQIEEMESVRAGNLWHLRTKLSGRIKTGLQPIIAALHPTPAVCGMPKNRAKEFILSNEDYEREFYTGYLGELNFKQMQRRNTNRKNQENNAYRTVKSATELYVNLRCMQLKGAKALVYVGGGITEASDPIKEWEETVAKSRTMLQVLNNS